MTVLRPHRNSYVVSPTLIAGEHPFRSHLCVPASLTRYHQLGIDTFIDLTSDGELPEYATLAGMTASDGITCLRFPIGDYRTPPHALMVAILDAIDAVAQRGGRAYLHCHAGIGRTGTAVGCWLVRHGATGHAALEHVSRLFHTTLQAQPGQRSPETAAQRAFIVEWQEERTQTTVTTR